MLRAMAEAELGEDGLGEGPTVIGEASYMIYWLKYVHIEQERKGSNLITIMLRNPLTSSRIIKTGPNSQSD